MRSRPRVSHLLSLTLILTFTFTLLLHSAATPSLTHSPPNPNVVLLLIDDAGFDDVFSQRLPAALARLPHVQSLARRGASFGSAYVTAPQCSPSRAAILTGKQCVCECVCVCE